MAGMRSSAVKASGHEISVCVGGGGGVASVKE